VCGHMYSLDPLMLDEPCSGDVCTSADRQKCCTHAYADSLDFLDDSQIGADIQGNNVWQLDYSTAMMCSAFATKGLPTRGTEAWKTEVISALKIHRSQFLNMTLNKNPDVNGLECKGSRDSCITTLCTAINVFPDKPMEPAHPLVQEKKFSSDVGTGGKSGFLVIVLVGVALLAAIFIVARLCMADGKHREACAAKVAKAIMLKYDTCRDGELNSAEFYAFVQRDVRPQFLGLQVETVERIQSDAFFEMKAPQRTSMRLEDVKKVCLDADAAELKYVADRMRVELDSLV